MLGPRWEASCLWPMHMSQSRGARPNERRPHRARCLPDCPKAGQGDALALGRAIREARSRNIDQVEIAKKLNLTREQVRRYQVEYEKSLQGADA